MITILSKKIAYYLVSASNTEPESDQIDVYIYGLECFLNTGFTILILVIWGLLTNTLLESCCWIAAFSILRHHSGGLHAPTHFSCILSSCLLGISNWLIIKNITYNLTILVIGYLFCIIVCILYAPTDSSKYELTRSMRKKEKIFSLSILIIGFIASLIFKNEISISILYSNICVCILLLIRIFIRKVKT